MINVSEVSDASIFRNFIWTQKTEAVGPSKILVISYKIARHQTPNPALYFHHRIRISIDLSVCLSLFISLSLYQSISLSICVSICLSIYLPIYLSGYNTFCIQRCTTVCGQMVWISSEATGCTGISTVERYYSVIRSRDRHTLYSTVSRMWPTTIKCYNYCLYYKF
jgi:hypothetical protein